MKVDNKTRKVVEELFQEAHNDESLSMLERTIIYAVGLVIFSYMEDE